MNKLDGGGGSKNRFVGQTRRTKRSLGKYQMAEPIGSTLIWQHYGLISRERYFG